MKPESDGGGEVCSHILIEPSSSQCNSSTLPIVLFLLGVLGEGFGMGRGSARAMVRFEVCAWFGCGC